MRPASDITEFGRSGVAAMTPLRRVLHVTESPGAGTLGVICQIAAILQRRGVQQMIMYSPRRDTPVDLRASFDVETQFVQVPPARGVHLDFIVSLTRALRQAVRDWRPDIVHLHSSKAGFVGRFAMAKMAARPRMYYSPHGLSFLDADNPFGNFLFQMLERLADRPYCRLVGCGAGERELLEAMSGRTADLLENSVSEQFFSTPRCVDPEKQVVVTIGRLTRQKNPKEFARLAQRTKQVVPRTRFVWIGDGDAAERARLLDAGCEVTGWVEGDTVRSLVAAADIYVQTSRWEGLPLSVLQAMAGELPCVVTDVIGNRDAVLDGVTGYVVATPNQLFERVMQLLNDPHLRAELGRNGRDCARRRFGPDAFAASLARLYCGSLIDCAEGDS